MSKSGFSKGIIPSVFARGGVTNVMLAVAMIATFGSAEAAMASDGSKTFGHAGAASFLASSATDLSSAKRQHAARRIHHADPAVRSFGGSMNFIAGSGTGGGYGYGYGDNSRNQTW